MSMTEMAASDTLEHIGIAEAVYSMKAPRSATEV